MTSNTTHPTLPDFDTMMAMSEEERAELKEEFITDMIARNPEKAQRIRALQWRIDQSISRSANNIAAMVEIQKQMRASLNRLNDALGAFRQ